MGNFSERLKFNCKVNWIKTLYFNFSKFPFATAKKLPVYFYGSVKLKSIKGEITIDAPIRKAMIGFGQPYEIITRSKRTAELCLDGKMIFKGHIQFGIDYFIHIAEGATLEMGHMSSLGNNGKIICYDKITFGKFARIGFESQIMDSSFHQMIDTQTNEKIPMTAPVRIGNYNYFGNRISVMPDTVTPDYCTVASNSVCNKDYTPEGNNILIGGIPAKLLRQNISRDWAGEQENMEKWLIV
jgi:acetyltransferase-like isoleucine patch superfamily enzyme